MSALHHDGYNAGNFMMQELYSAQNMSPEVEHTVVRFPAVWDRDV